MQMNHMSHNSITVTQVFFIILHSYIDVKKKNIFFFMDVHL
jgi:hypothetical protein